MSAERAGVPRAVTVVGAGVVGTSIAFTLLREGHRVRLVDPAGPGRETSFGNAGGIAASEVVPLSVPGLMRHLPRWLLDPEGPLAVRWRYLPRLAPWLWRFRQAGRPERVAAIADALAALAHRVYEDLDPLLAAAGLRDLLVRRGCLTLYETADEFERDSYEWALRRERGIRLEILDPPALAELEPAVARRYAVAVLKDDWTHVLDPYGLVAGLAERFAADGGEILPGRVVDVETASGTARAIRLADGGRLPVGTLVVAAGVWSRPLAKALGHRIPLEAERGYHATLPRPGVALSRMLSLARDRFVITPLAAGIRVAGTAEFAGLAAPPDYARARVLVRKAQDVLPGLDATAASEWMGCRPSLPDSLPVIGPAPGYANVYYAFGHGHLGLTFAATTARLIADLVAGRRPALPLDPYRPDRF